MRISAILMVAIFAVATSATAQAQDKNKGKADVQPSELKAKVDYCKTCHGLSGQGFRCRDSPDSSPNISKISSRRSSIADAAIR
jgi:cytochrome c553